MQTPPTYLAADRVSKVFHGPNGASTAVDGVSFSVPEGSFVSIVGPSGCGKSTILGMIAGLIAPTSGRTVLGERTVTRPPVDMVYLFQQYSKSLLPWRTVSRNIELGLEAPARRRSLTRTQIAERCARYLELVGLSGTEDHYPWQLSGGMQQRVAIARALVCEPKVLLMDEPFSAVDALTRSSLQDLVLSLWEKLGITILFVTHDIDEAIFLSDKIYVLTKAPAHIVHTLDVELPRPRHQVETRELPRFLEYRRELLARVMG